jgi:hypothetical protein
MSSGNSRAFKFFDHVPVIRDTGDPEYAGIFVLFACAVLIALIVLGNSNNAYTHVLQTAGGALVALGVYLTTVNLRSTRSEHYASRLMTAMGQLNSESEATRVGTIRLLEAMLVETPKVNTADRERLVRYKEAVVEALDVIAAQGETREADVARSVASTVAASLAEDRVQPTPVQANGSESR